MKIVILWVSVLFTVALQAQPSVFEYQGTWRFDREQFEDKHYLLPGFMVNRAMKTRLVLADDYFAQYDDDREIIGVKRPLEILKRDENEYALQRLDDGKPVQFFMQQRDDGIYFVEGKDEYKLILVTDEPALD